MKPKRRYLWTLTVICLILVVVHGIEKFKVDVTTLGLLALAALPVLWEIVGSIKAGGVEVSFRELAVHKQVFKFLDGIAAQRAWTFYPPRAGESDLGQGLGIIIDNLNRKHEAELRSQLEDWLEVESSNIRWFASEIIGYFKIVELKDKLPYFFKGLDEDASWETWQLNCLWAYSRFNNYEELNVLLNRTKSDANQLWILAAYDQMVSAKDDTDGYIAKYTNEFKQRSDITEQARAAAAKVLEQPA